MFASLFAFCEQPIFANKMQTICQILPSDIWHCVFQYSTLEDLVRFAMVNRNCYELAGSDQVWQNIATSNFNMPKNLQQYKQHVIEFLSYQFQHPLNTSITYSQYNTSLVCNSTTWETALCKKRIIPGGGTYRIGFAIIDLTPSSNLWHIMFGLVPATFTLSREVPGTMEDNSHAMGCTSGTYMNRYQSQQAFEPCFNGCVYGMEVEWTNSKEKAHLRLFQEGICKHETKVVLSDTEYRFCISMVRQQSAKIVPWPNVVVSKINN